MANAFNGLSKNTNENVKKYAISKNDHNEKGTLSRIKRQSPLDSFEFQHTEEMVRRKRLTNYLEDVKMKLEQCKRIEMNKSECEKFYREMVAVSKMLNEEIPTITKIAANFENSDQTRPNSENQAKTLQWIDSAGNPLRDFNREEKFLEKIQHSPKFHEDLDNNQRTTLWQVDDPSSKYTQDLPKPQSPATQSHSLSAASARDNDKSVPLKNQNFGKN